MSDQVIAVRRGFFFGPVGVQAEDEVQGRREPITAGALSGCHFPTYSLTDAPSYFWIIDRLLVAEVFRLRRVSVFCHAGKAHKLRYQRLISA